MTRYSGPCELRVGDGDYTGATARLLAAAGETPSWEGSIESAEFDWYTAITVGQTVSVRLPSGNTGDAIVVGHSAGATTARVKGTSPPMW